MKALVGAFNQEKALVGAFSVIVQPVVEPMELYTALVLGQGAARAPHHDGGQVTVAGHRRRPPAGHLTCGPGLTCNAHYVPHVKC